MKRTSVRGNLFTFQDRIKELHVRLELLEARESAQRIDKPAVTRFIKHSLGPAREMEVDEQGVTGDGE